MSQILSTHSLISKEPDQQSIQCCSMPPVFFKSTGMKNDVVHWLAGKDIINMQNIWVIHQFIIHFIWFTLTDCIIADLAMNPAQSNWHKAWWIRVRDSVLLLKAAIKITFGMFTLSIQWYFSPKYSSNVNPYLGAYSYYTRSSINYEQGTWHFTFYRATVCLENLTTIVVW